MIQLAGMSDGMRIVTGTEEQHIKTGQGGNFLNLLHCLGIFDLQNDKPLLIGLPGIFMSRNIAILGIGIAAIHRPSANWMETGHANHILSILHGHDVGNHNAGGIQLQGADIIAVGASGHTNQDIRIVNFRCHDLLFGSAVIIGGMLRIYPNTGKACHSGDLHHTGISSITLTGKYNLSCPQQLQCLTSSHIHSYITPYSFSGSFHLVYSRDVFLSATPFSSTYFW